MTTEGALAPLIGREPAQWPSPPDPLSFSALLMLRQCPRRWAYARARFEPGGLFDDAGRLQERANWAAARGRIVHATLQTLLEIHRREGGPPAGSWSLVQFWKRHLPPGGVPALVSATTEGELDALARVPRNRPILSWLRQRAAQEAGTLVASVNAKLGVALADVTANAAGRGESSRAERRELGVGAHPEVVVEATLHDAVRVHRWRGVIDVARVADVEITLVDYKGGSEQPPHREQLEIYSLLFARDSVINPAGRRASELMLAYDNGRTVVWPAPDEAALAALERGLLDEVEQLSRSVEVRPPEARPAPDACGLCAARALCGAFWSQPQQACDPEVDDRAGYLDLEMQVMTVSGPGDEVTGVPTAATRELNRRVRVLVPSILRPQARSTAAGDHVRILGAQEVRASTDEVESSDAILALGPFAEIIRIARP